MERSAPWAAVVFAALLALTPPAAQGARLRLPAPTPETVQLVGEVTVAGTHSGVLELRLDGVVHAQVPAGQGRFEIALPTTAAAGMVSLEYVAPGLRLRSLLGGQQRLARLAGSDGRVTPDDEDGLHVTPFATALAVLGASIDGVPPADDRALAEAVQAAWSSDFVVVATAIDRLAADPGRLPAGYADGLALVEDVDAFNALLQADPELVASPELVFDALPATMFDALALHPMLVMPGPRGAPGSPPTGPGLLLEPEGDAYRIHGFGFGREAYAGAWDPSALLLVPEEPVTYFGGYWTCPSRPGVMVPSITRLNGRDLRRRWRGQGVSLWQLASDMTSQLADCPGSEPVQRRQITFRAAPSIPRNRVHDPAGMMVGRHSIPLFCGDFLPHDVVIRPCGVADHVLERDGTGIAYPAGRAALAVAWGRDADGAMRFDYGEGLDGGVMPSRQWLLDAGDGTTQAVFWLAEGSVDGSDGSASGFATRVRGGLEGWPVGAAAAAGRPAGPRYEGIPD